MWGAEFEPVEHTGNRSQSSVDSDPCQCQTPGKICSHRRSEKKNIPQSYLSKGDAAQKTLGTANKLILHVLFPEDVNWWAQLKAKTHSETCNLAGFFSLNWFYHHWSLALSTRALGPLSRGNWMLEKLLLLTVWMGRKEAVWTSGDGSVATGVCCASWPLVQGKTTTGKDSNSSANCPEVVSCFTKHASNMCCSLKPCLSF